MLSLQYYRVFVGVNLTGCLGIIAANATLLVLFPYVWTKWLALWTAVEGLAVLFGIIDCLMNRRELWIKLFLTISFFLVAIKIFADVALFIELIDSPGWTPVNTYFCIAFNGSMIFQGSLFFGAICLISDDSPTHLPPTEEVRPSGTPVNRSAIRESIALGDVSGMATRLGVVVTTSRPGVCPVCNETTDSMAVCASGHAHCIVCLAGWMSLSNQELRCTLCRKPFPRPESGV